MMNGRGPWGAAIPAVLLLLGAACGSGPKIRGESDPKDVRSVRAEARRLESRGDLAGAARLVQEALEGRSQDVALRFEVARLLYLQGEVHDRQHLERSTGAADLLGKGRSREAEEEFDRCKEDRERADRLFGEALWNLNRVGNSEEGKKFPEVDYYAGRILIFYEEYQGAAKRLTRYIESGAPSETEKAGVRQVLQVLQEESEESTGGGGGGSHETP